MVDLYEICHICRAVNAGFFEAKKSILLAGLSSARKYSEFSRSFKLNMIMI